MARIHEADDAKDGKKGISAALAGAASFVRGVKRRVEFEFCDDDRFAWNMKLARAIGLFGASIFLMSNFGDNMAI